jgi:hypothetical protein
MRKTNYCVLFLFLSIAFFQACEETDDGTYTAPITLYEIINGTYSLTDITEWDEVAKVNNLTPTDQSIASKFNFKTFKITFNVDSSGSSYQPTTYSVTGTAPELFPNSGYWQLDEPFYHADQTTSSILLFSDEACTQQTDKLTVTSFPSDLKPLKRVLEFSLTRYDNGVPFVTYAYELKPSN